ncbi:hypothetical protein BD413DRAFT_7150 [Trametes elegans]|nr:hypothetical protein BD413DRAFT_7150 [Trametes elegans]
MRIHEAAPTFGDAQLPPRGDDMMLDVLSLPRPHTNTRVRMGARVDYPTLCTASSMYLNDYTSGQPRPRGRDRRCMDRHRRPTRRLHAGLLGVSKSHRTHGEQAHTGRTFAVQVPAEEELEGAMVDLPYGAQGRCLGWECRSIISHGERRRPHQDLAGSLCGLCHGWHCSLYSHNARTGWTSHTSLFLTASIFPCHIRFLESHIPSRSRAASSPI